jgi:hypothetical protein
MTESHHGADGVKILDGPGYTITFEEIGDILELVIQGRATHQNADQIRDAVMDIARDHQKPLLVDVRGIEGRLNVGRTYHHVRGRASPPLGRKTAVIDLLENAEHSQFYDITATNAGLNVRHFHTPEEGRAWLRE